MSYELLAALNRQLVADADRSRLRGPFPLHKEIDGKQRGFAMSPHPPSGENMDARLRGIRHYITPKELAFLLHIHRETVYRKIKSGMPAHRDVDAQGRGRRLKIYPPEIADWLRDCREQEKRCKQSKSGSPTSNRKNSKAVGNLDSRK